jgi:opacity protein-like surface antigen
MKNILAVVALAVCMAVPSFASDVIGHSAKVTGKETYKTAKVSLKDTAKAGKAVVKFLF